MKSDTVDTAIRAVSYRRTDYNTNRIAKYSSADKSLAWPGRKQATATEDFDVHISYLLS
jgi:hypothetical protein